MFSRCFQSGGAGIGERSALIGGAPSARSRAPQKATSQAGQDISGSPPDRGHGRPAPHHVPGPAGGSAFCARDPADPVLVGIAGARETPPNSPVTPTPKNTARLGSPRTAQCRPNGPSGQHPAAAESSWEPCRRVGISAVVHDPRQSDRGTSGRTFGLIVLADLVRAEAAPGGRWPDGAVSGAPLYRGIRCAALPQYPAHRSTAMSDAPLYRAADSRLQNLERGSTSPARTILSLPTGVFVGGAEHRAATRDANTRRAQGRRQRGAGPRIDICRKSRTVGGMA